jgi:hypothetical protein
VSIPGDIALQTKLHESGRWITIPLFVKEIYSFTAVLDTGAPVSAISPQIAADMQLRDLLQPSPIPRRHRMTGLSSQGYSLPDLDIAVLNRLARIGVDGLLGLDFLMHFEHIHFHTRSLRLELER